MLKIPKVILLIESSRLSGRDILAGIAKYTQLYGPWQFYRRPPVYIQSDQKLDIKKLKEWNPDGIIARDTDDVKLILRLGIAAVISKVVSKDLPRCYTLEVDSASAGKLQVEHLLDRGFSNFAFIGFDDMPWSQANCKSVQQRLAKTGFDLNLYQQPRNKSKPSVENEQLFIAEWLKTLPKPVGLIACNDIRAQQVIEAARIAGLRVPEQIAVIGADNDETICNLTDPPLSSVSLDYVKAGFQMAELLDKLMKAQHVTQKNLVVKAQAVIARQSTNTMAIEDPEVAHAMHFIKKFSRKYLKVIEVCDAVSCPRRSLERKFRNALGRSVTDEIKRWHCQSIAQMLLETDLSIEKIAIELGHPDAKHIARFFKKVKGSTPGEYRKREIANTSQNAVFTIKNPIK